MDHSNSIELPRRPVRRASFRPWGGGTGDFESVLNNIITQIGTVPLPELLKGIVAADAKAIGVERVSYWSMESAGDAIRRDEQFLLSRGFESTALRLTARDFPGYFHALEDATSLIVADDAPADPRLAEFRETYFKPLKIGAMLDAPVHRNGRLFGVVCHEHIGGARQWTGPEIDFARSISHLIALAIETETRQQAEAALRESEARYRTAVEHTPAAIVVLDPATGKFAEANDNAVTLFGLSRPDLLKAGPADLSPEVQGDGRPSAEVAREKIAAALGGETPVFEWLHMDRDRREIPCEIRLAKMPAKGRTLVIGAITEISERKRAETELRKALEQERELSELKSTFVNVVSHEFRTPLGVIVSSTDILEHYFDRLKPDQRKGHLQDIRFAARQMSGLMEEVLLLGRVDSGRMQCRPDSLDLAGFCQRLADEQLSATNRKCPIRLSLENCDGDARGDEALLRHIFTNLLSNAVKYSPAGRSVDFEALRAGAWVVFSVSDGGIGITPDDQKRLFEAFHRGSNVGDTPGTGLGLVIVKRCVDLHGGTIHIASEPGKGTIATVRLPLFPKGKETRTAPGRTQ